MTRYGILGFGHHAAKRLVPAFAAAQHSTLTGLWRRDPAKAKTNAEQFGVAHTFDSAESLCASPQIDAVFVASPDALHVQHVLLALKHGKPVLCEKPLAMSVAEVETMLAAQAAAGVAFGVAQNMRYNRSLQLMRQWIGEDRIAEAVVLKTLGASRAQIRRAWLVEFAVAGGIAGLAAAIFGTLAAALTIREVFHTDWHFEPVILAVTLLGSIGFMLVFGYASTAQALREPAAARLRLEGGA